VLTNVTSRNNGTKEIHEEISLKLQPALGRRKFKKKNLCRNEMFKRNSISKHSVKKTRPTDELLLHRFGKSDLFNVSDFVSRVFHMSIV
jgi:hypothetical protein